LINNNKIKWGGKYNNNKKQSNQSEK
jgi:hypothetical protein